MKNVFKKALILFLFTLIIQISTVKANSIHPDVTEFFSIYSEFEKNWFDAEIKKVDKIYGENDEVVGSVNRIYDKSNQQQGYIIYFEGEGVIEATFEKQDRFNDLNGKIYYVMPGRFMTKQAFRDYMDNAEYQPYEPSSYLFGSGTGTRYDDDPANPGEYLNTSVDYTISTTHLPDLASNVSTYFSWYSYKKVINDVPDYMGWPKADFRNGCVPVSTANLIAYFDREYDDSFSDLEGANNSFSLTHDDYADDLINELGDYMGNCIDATTGDPLDPEDCHGVGYVEPGAGTNNYFDDTGNGEWELYFEDMTGSFDEYQAVISLGNPTILFLLDHPTYGNHGVTGIGYYTLNGAPPGVIIHDNWNNNDTIGKEVWLSASVIRVFAFIYD